MDIWDVRKRDMKSSGLNSGMWEALASARVTWRAEVLQSTLRWGIAHHPGSGSEKSKDKGRLQDFNNSI